MEAISQKRSSGLFSLIFSFVFLKLHAETDTLHLRNKNLKLIITAFHILPDSTSPIPYKHLSGNY